MTWLYQYRNRPDDNFFPGEVDLVQRFLEEYTQKMTEAPTELRMTTTVLLCRTEKPDDALLQKNSVQGRGNAGEQAWYILLL